MWQLILLGNTVQLAVLGACQCREVDGRRPCVCAYAASSFAREMYQMREEVRQTSCSVAL